MQPKSIFNNLYTSKYFSNLPDFKEKRTQAYITIALTLVALSFFGLFAITPTISTIANLQKQKEDNTFVEEKLDQKKANLIALSNAYTSIEPNLPYVFSALPKTPDIPNFTGQLYALSKDTSVGISRIQTYQVELTKSSEGIQQFSSFSFNVDASGTYANLNKYLQSLTKFNRIITLDSVSINKGPDKDSGLQMIIQGKAYFKL
jgi:Tfp pilus assembly protein PilO